LWFLRGVVSEKDGKSCSNGAATLWIGFRRHPWINDANFEQKMLLRFITNTDTEFVMEYSFGDMSQRRLLGIRSRMLAASMRALSLVQSAKYKNMAEKPVRYQKPKSSI